MTFEEAQTGVKIGHFTRQGFTIRGVVHVGANDGEEIPYYFALGAQAVIAFEPLDSAYEHLCKQWLADRRVTISHFGLSDTNTVMVLKITEGGGKGSSFLRGPDSVIDKDAQLVRRFDGLHLDLAPYNTLVVDAQGMELQVLRGFGEKLKAFDFLNIECSRVPIYDGEAPAQDVINFLTSRGFDQDSPIQDHDDIMFVKRGLK